MVARSAAAGSGKVVEDAALDTSQQDGRVQENRPSIGHSQRAPNMFTTRARMRRNLCCGSGSHTPRQPPCTALTVNFEVCSLLRVDITLQQAVSCRHSGWLAATVARDSAPAGIGRQGQSKGRLRARGWCTLQGGSMGGGVGDGGPRRTLRHQAHAVAACLWRCCGSTEMATVRPPSRPLPSRTRQLCPPGSRQMHRRWSWRSKRWHTRTRWKLCWLWRRQYRRAAHRTCAAGVTMGSRLPSGGH